MSLSDQNLVGRVQLERDRLAFDQLVRRHQSTIRNSLRQWLGGDDASADDLAQETFLKAYRNIDNYRQSASFVTWLYRIAYNLFVDHYRKAPQTQSLPDDYDIPADIASLPNAGLQQALANALMSLPVQERTAVHLSLQRQYTHQEITEIMGLPLGTVKTHVARGRQKLERKLARWK